MRQREILLGETAGFQHRDRERIAHRQRRGGARGRGQAQRAGFLADADIEVDIGAARQRRLRIAGERNQRNAQAFQQWQQQRDFAGFTGIGKRYDEVLRGDHAEVTVAGFARMHEKRRCSGACQRGRDLVTDMARLAHAGDDYPAFAFQHQVAGIVKALVQP